MPKDKLTLTETSPLIQGSPHSAQQRAPSYLTTFYLMVTSIVPLAIIGLYFYGAYYNFEDIKNNGKPRLSSTEECNINPADVPTTYDDYNDGYYDAAKGLPANPPTSGQGYSLQKQASHLDFAYLYGPLLAQLMSCFTKGALHRFAGSAIQRAAIPVLSIIEFIGWPLFMILISSQPEKSALGFACNTVFNRVQLQDDILNATGYETNATTLHEEQTVLHMLQYFRGFNDSKCAVENLNNANFTNCNGGLDYNLTSYSDSIEISGNDKDYHAQTFYPAVVASIILFAYMLYFFKLFFNMCGAYCMGENPHTTFGRPPRIPEEHSTITQTQNRTSTFDPRFVN